MQDLFLISINNENFHGRESYTITHNLAEDSNYKSEFKVPRVSLPSLMPDRAAMDSMGRALWGAISDHLPESVRSNNIFEHRVNCKEPFRLGFSVPVDGTWDIPFELAAVGFHDEASPICLLNHVLAYRSVSPKLRRMPAVILDSEIRLLVILQMDDELKVGTEDYENVKEYLQKQFYGGPHKFEIVQQSKKYNQVPKIRNPNMLAYIGHIPERGDSNETTKSKGFISGESQITRWIKHYPELQVAMILGCFSHRDYAQRFISSGVPCVVALQHRLDAGEAIGFLERFVSSLVGATNYGRLDFAFLHARNGLDASRRVVPTLSLSGRQWCMLSKDEDLSSLIRYSRAVRDTHKGVRLPRLLGKFKSKSIQRYRNRKVVSEELTILEWPHQITSGDRLKSPKNRNKPNVPQTVSRTIVSDEKKLYRELVQSNSDKAAKIAVVGQVGSGKSSLSRRMAWRLARRFLRCPSLDGGLIPILLDGRQLPECDDRTPIALSLAQVKAIAVEHSLNADAIAKAFSRVGWSCIVLLCDGLDEPSFQEKDLGYKWRTQFENPILYKTPSLVTCRPSVSSEVDWNELPHFKGVEYSLARWTQEDLKAYIKNWEPQIDPEKQAILFSHIENSNSIFSQIVADNVGGPLIAAWVCMKASEDELTLDKFQEFLESANELSFLDEALRQCLVIRYCDSIAGPKSELAALAFCTSRSSQMRLNEIANKINEYKKQYQKKYGESPELNCDLTEDKLMYIQLNSGLLDHRSEVVFSESLYREYLIAFHLAQCINKGWDELVILFDDQGSVRTPSVNDLLAHWTFQHEKSARILQLCVGMLNIERAREFFESLVPGRLHRANRSDDLLRHRLAMAGKCAVNLSNDAMVALRPTLERIANELLRLWLLAMHGVSSIEYKRRRHAIRHWEDALSSLATVGVLPTHVYPMPHRARKFEFDMRLSLLNSVTVQQRKPFLNWLRDALNCTEYSNCSERFNVSDRWSPRYYSQSITSAFKYEDEVIFYTAIIFKDYLPLDFLREITAAAVEGEKHSRLYGELAAAFTNSQIPKGSHPESEFGDDGRIVGRYPDLLQIDPSCSDLEKNFQFSLRLAQLTQPELYPEKDGEVHSRNGFTFFDLTFPLAQGLVENKGKAFVDETFTKIASCLSPARRMTVLERGYPSFTSFTWNSALLVLQGAGAVASNPAIIKELEAFAVEPNPLSKSVLKRLLFYKICRFRWFFPSPLLAYLGSFVLDRHITDEERLAVSSGKTKAMKVSISRLHYLARKNKATFQVLEILEQIFPELESKSSEKQYTFRVFQDFVRSAFFSEHLTQAALAATRSRTMLADDEIVNRIVQIIREHEFKGNTSEWDLNSLGPGGPNVYHTEYWLERVPLNEYKPVHFVVLQRLANNGVFLFCSGSPKRMSWSRSQSVPHSIGKTSFTVGVAKMEFMHRTRIVNLPVVIVFGLIFSSLSLGVLIFVDMIVQVVTDKMFFYFPRDAEPSGSFALYHFVRFGCCAASFPIIAMIASSVLEMVGITYPRDRSTGYIGHPNLPFWVFVSYILSFVWLWLLG